jgi:hypothetical protein
MKLLVALIIPAIVLGVAAFETQIFDTPSSNGPAKGIVWQGRTFASRADFASWLRSRGVSYAAWARRHQAFLPPRARRKAERAARAQRADHNKSDWSLRNVGGGLAILAGLGLAAAFVRRRWPGSPGAVRQTLGLAARRATPAAKGGARLMLHWAKVTALLSWRTAKSSARIIRSRGVEFGGFLVHRAAPAGKGRARSMLDLAAVFPLPSASLASPSADTFRRRRGEFAWYLFTALLAVGLGVVATVWLNRA